VCFATSTLEDLDGDGQITGGEDRNSDGTFFDPEDALDYETYFRYDANGNLVEVHRENAGERGGSAARVVSNEFWTTRTAYDLLDHPVVTLAEIDPLPEAALVAGAAGVSVTRMGYDCSENLAWVLGPEGQATSVVYDERHLPFQTT